MKSFIKTSLAIIAFGLVTTGNVYAGEANANAAVVKLNNSWNQAFNNANAGLLASMYAETAVLSPGNGKVLKGRTEIENLFKSFFEAGLNNHKLEIVTVGGDEKSMHQVAKWSAVAAEKDGVKATYSGITSSTYQKDANGNWVATSHVWNAGN
jgi:uncharacterized protein (TIGR02246 family)